MPLVECHSVVKEYAQDFLGRRKLRAVDGVTFAIQPGEVFGLIGPNRAGKTTLVKLLLSLSTPTSGNVLRFGQPACQRGTLARVGYVHENQAFPRYLSARQLLEYYGALTFLPQPVVKERVPRLLERVGLADRADEPVARFSKGMVQRLGLAQALINEPELLVLDEPSEGLDLAGRQLVRDVVTQQRDQGFGVLFVSHLIPEIERLCQRIAVLRGGRLIFLGTMDELKRGPDGERNLEDVLGQLYFAKAG